jgi:hypothetical protein
MAQSNDARNFTAPNIAVTKSFSDCPAKPSKEKSSGAYALDGQKDFSSNGI